MKLSSFALAMALLPGTAVILVACGREPSSAAPQAVTAETVCTLDGMSVADYPGPKAQIQYADSPTEFFCDTVEMFAMLLRPEQQRRITAVYTQDMAKTEWDRPIEHWINARTAFYVRGSRKNGSMGPTFAAFASRPDAEGFAKENGGTVLAFDEVTPDMADLRGGAAHDEHM